jgi:hypothetical protein
LTGLTKNDARFDDNYFVRCQLPDWYLIYGAAFCYSFKESIINNLFVNKRKVMNFDVFFNTAQIGTALTIIAFVLVLMLRKQSHKK